MLISGFRLRILETLPEMRGTLADSRKFIDRIVISHRPVALGADGA